MKHPIREDGYWGWGVRLKGHYEGVLAGRYYFPRLGGPGAQLEGHVRCLFSTRREARDAARDAAGCHREPVKVFVKLKWRG